jgi:Ribbon-helix-helix protein, copG family
MERLNVTLDDEYAAELERLAERMHGTESLLVLSSHPRLGIVGEPVDRLG